MASWDELVSVALLGTEQQPAPALSGQSPVETLLGKLESAAGRSKESVLLSAAATVSLHTRAGQAPSKSAAPQQEPPEDEDGVLINIGMNNLRLLFDQYAKTLLPLWLNHLSKKNYRLPAAAAPMLLEYGRVERQLRPAVKSILGKRGRWLGQQNKDWSFAAIEEVSDTDADELRNRFETGSELERISIMGQLRASSPAVGRELLAAAWAEETYQHKVSFLEVFATNLSMEDEPFLEETALGDKRKEVRTMAGNLLANLTASRFHQRMKARALPLLKVQGLLKKELDISLPQEVDAEMVRDGFTKFPATVSADDRQSCLAYMLSMLSPAVWEEHLKMNPEQIINLKPPHYVYNAWQEATLLHKNERWTEAFMCQVNTPMHYNELLTIAPAQVRERILLSMIQRNSGKLHIKGNEYQQPIMLALMSCNHDWSEDFGRKVMPALVEEARASSTYYYTRQMFEHIGFFFPTTLAKDIEQSLKTREPQNSEHVDKFFSTLKFKCELYGETK